MFDVSIITQDHLGLACSQDSLQCIGRFGLRWDPLWPRDAIRRYRSGSTLVQVMACYLLAPSNYLNQCWLAINGVLWHSPETNFTGITQDIYLKMSLKNTVVKLIPHLSGYNDWSTMIFSRGRVNNDLDIGGWNHLPVIRAGRGLSMVIENAWKFHRSQGPEIHYRLHEILYRRGITNLYLDHLIIQATYTSKLLEPMYIPPHWESNIHQDRTV